MFFTEPWPFKEVLDQLSQIERAING
jgi:hypothetical protein